MRKKYKSFAKLFNSLLHLSVIKRGIKRKVTYIKAVKLISVRKDKNTVRAYDVDLQEIFGG